MEIKFSQIARVIRVEVDPVKDLSQEDKLSLLIALLDSYKIIEALVQNKEFGAIKVLEDQMNMRNRLI